MKCLWSSSRIRGVGVLRLGIIHLVLTAGGAGAQTFEAGAGHEQGAAIETFAGWSASAPATAQISAEEAASGAQSLKIMPSAGENFTEFSYSPAADGVNFVDFWIRPAVEAEPRVAVEVDGAMVGFVGTENGTGEVVGVVPDANGAFQSHATGREFLVDAGGVATEWVRLTLRRDRPQQKWDLFVDGALVVINLPAQNAAAPRLRFYAAPAAVYVDDITVGATNPLYADYDKDGLPDFYEKTFGLAWQVNNRLADKDRDGRSDWEEFLLGSRPDVPEGQGAGSVIYVDNSCGSDANTGQSPIAGPNGPKASIVKAVDESSDGGIVMVLRGLGTYSENKNLNFLAPVTLRFEDSSTKLTFHQND